MQVGWSVAGPGETHGFIPEEIEGTLEKFDPKTSGEFVGTRPGEGIDNFFSLFSKPPDHYHYCNIM